MTKSVPDIFDTTSLGFLTKEISSKTKRHNPEKWLNLFISDFWTGFVENFTASRPDGADATQYFMYCTEAHPNPEKRRNEAVLRLSVTRQYAFTHIAALPNPPKIIRENTKDRTITIDQISTEGLLSSLYEKLSEIPLSAYSPEAIEFFENFELTDTLKAQWLAKYLGETEIADSGTLVNSDGKIRKRGRPSKDATPYIHEIFEKRKSETKTEETIAAEARAIIRTLKDFPFSDDQIPIQKTVENVIRAEYNAIKSKDVSK